MKKMFNAFVAFFLVFTFLCSTSALAVFSYDVAAKVGNEPLESVYFAIGKNGKLTNDLSDNSNLRSASTNVETLEMSITNITKEQTDAILTLRANETICNVLMVGNVYPITDADGLGYVGVFEGYIRQNDNYVSVIADVLYAQDQNALVTLTIGTMGNNPEIIVFGEYTNAIRKLSNYYAGLVKSQQSKITKVELKEAPFAARIDGVLQHQNSVNITAQGYNLGVVSIFHPNELGNQNNMTVFAKVNSNSVDCKDYLVATQDTSTNKVLSAYPDTFIISINGKDKYLHNDADSYLPKAGSSSLSLKVPVFLTPTGSIKLVDFNITTSKTTVTSSGFGGVYTNNTLTWNINQRNGWGSDLDGDKTSNTGMSVQGTYLYEGNVSQNKHAGMSADGSIRYQYVSWNPQTGDSFVRHMTTSVASAPSTVTIVP